MNLYEGIKNNLDESFEPERPLSPPEVDEKEVTGRIIVTYMFNTTVPTSWNHEDVENELRSNLSDYIDEIEDVELDFSYEGPGDYKDRMVDEHIYDDRMED